MNAKKINLLSDLSKKLKKHNFRFLTGLCLVFILLFSAILATNFSYAKAEITGYQFSPDTRFTTIAGKNSTRIELMFTNPTLNNPDKDIINQFTRLLDSVPSPAPKANYVYGGFTTLGCVDDDAPSSSSKMTACINDNEEAKFQNWGLSKPYEAINRAIGRGVSLKLVVDGSGLHPSIVHDNKTGEDISKPVHDDSYADIKLMKNSSPNLHIKLCYKASDDPDKKGEYTTGCTTMPDESVNHIQHMKYTLFSKAQDQDGNMHSYVTWITSSNFGDRSASPFENNSIVIYDDKTLYEGLRDMNNKQFNEQRDDKNPLIDYLIGDSGITVYASPYPKGLMILNHIEPWTNIKNQEGCVVRTMNNYFDNVDLVNGQGSLKGLRTLKNNGCDVKVENLENPPKTIFSDLEDATGVTGKFSQSVIDALNVAPKIPFIQEGNMHSKILAIKGRTSEDGPLRKFLFLGSECFGIYTPGNNELRVKLPLDEGSADQEFAWQMFMDHFNDKW